MVKILNMGKATAVVPELMYVLDKLSIKKPLFQYEATNYRETSTSLNEIKVWVSGVRVVQDAESVGNIEHRQNAGRMNSNGDQPDAFLIESVHIKKARGNKSTIITSDANVAVKQAIKHFAPMDKHDICNTAIKKTTSLLERVAYKARTSLSDICSYNGSEVMQYFIERELLGNNVPLPPSLKLHKDKLHLYDMFLAGKQIQRQFDDVASNRKGYAIWTLSDNSVRVLHLGYNRTMKYEDNVANGIELNRYRNFEELPANMQNKIAVLKIAEYNDPILDIGVKLKDDDEIYMYILE